jgi:hypothetical protein
MPFPGQVLARLSKVRSSQASEITQKKCLKYFLPKNVSSLCVFVTKQYDLSHLKLVFTYVLL